MSVREPVTALFGAGFSKPYGGFLGSDIVGQIIAHPRLSRFADLRKEVIDDWNFEVTLGRYQAIRDHSVSSVPIEPDRVQVLEQVILDVFAGMDRRMQSHQDSGNLDFLRDFVGRFNRGGVLGSCIFTLNQDLLIERHAFNDSEYRLVRPGVTDHLVGEANRSVWFSARADGVSFKDVECELNHNSAETMGRFCYVKLHGSIDWVDENGRLVILGYDKEARTKKHQLLAKYWDIFEDRLAESDRLLVSGYSFRDRHVNDCIVRAILRSDVGVYIWDELPKDQMQATWKEQNIESEMLVGLRGYFTITPPQGSRVPDPNFPGLDWFFGDDQ